MEAKIAPEQKRNLLRLLQKEFPLTRRPFLAIARRVKLKEREIIKLLQGWAKEGKLRQISAVFNPQAFGHKSSLFALRIKEANLNLAIERINNHPGVSHSYLRDHEYNLWFTLVVPPGQDLLTEAQKLCQDISDDSLMHLPVIKKFKISAVFGLEEEENSTGAQTERSISYSERDVEFVKALQEPLTLTKEPFLEKAKKLNCSEKAIFDWLRRMKEQSALRRFGALFKHDRLGYAFNVMVAWEVDNEQVDKVGKALARRPEITHCYLRQSYPHWKYNLYTMCHFKEPSYREAISAWAKDLGIEKYLLLTTVKELKKVRLKLFYA